MKTERRRFGDFGESISVKFLMKHGFRILERNYLRPWGEIDIVAEKGARTYFIEVKTALSRETEGEGVSHETIRPEDNIHPEKLKRFFKIVQTYCLEKNIDESTINLMALIVRINADHKRAKISVLKDLVL